MVNPPPEPCVPARSRTVLSPQRRSRSDFYVAMALAIVAVVAFGFGQTLQARVIHPPSPRPWILYLHIALFGSWVLIFLAQSTLVRSGQTRLHRRLGALGIAMGAAMPFVGLATALVMARLNVAPKAVGIEDEAFLAVSVFDMVAFAVLFWIAVWYRRRPDYHRRLMLMATCGLTVAAFARFPSELMPDNAWYLAVDALILVGVARDLFVDRRLHPIYGIGLPALMLGQAATMWIYITRPGAWLAIARILFQVP